MVKKSKRAFRTISEAADDLDVPQHVLRFWETKFSAIKPMKRGGNRRFYRPGDIDLLKAIKRHLYDLDKSIKEVQALIKDSGVKTFVEDWKKAAGVAEEVAPEPKPGPGVPEAAPKQEPVEPETVEKPPVPEEEPGLTFEAEDQAKEKAEPAPEATPEAADGDSVKVSKDLVRALVNDLKALRQLIDRLP